jgi:photosystem II stability/assembly factor-like uncharacterized protein
VETLVQVGITGAAVTEDGRIVLVSQEGHVLVSDDGARFRAVKVERPIPVSAVVSLDKTTLALAGLRGLHVRKID